MPNVCFQPGMVTFSSVVFFKKVFWSPSMFSAWHLSFFCWVVFHLTIKSIFYLIKEIDFQVKGVCVFVILERSCLPIGKT